MSLLAALRSWLSTAGSVKPSRAFGLPAPGDAAPRGTSLAPFTNPSSGLANRQELLPSAGGSYRGAHELDKPESSLYGRPSRRLRTLSLSRSFGDANIGEPENSGRKTVIAARTSAPTILPGGIASRVPWVGADYRTAPSGEVGARAGGMTPFGPDAPITSQRQVPPTDAASAGTRAPIPTRTW